MPGVVSGTLGTQQFLSHSCSAILKPRAESSTKYARDANRAQRQKLFLGTWAPILAAMGGEAAQLLGRILQKQHQHGLSFLTHGSLLTLRFCNF